MVIARLVNKANTRASKIGARDGRRGPEFINAGKKSCGVRWRTTEESVTVCRLPTQCRRHLSSLNGVANGANLKPCTYGEASQFGV